MKFLVLSICFVGSILLGFWNSVFRFNTQDPQAVTAELYNQVKVCSIQQKAIKQAVTTACERQGIDEMDVKLLRIQAEMITAGLNPEQTGAEGIGLRLNIEHEKKPAAPAYQNLLTSFSKAN